ncbi:MAG: hypothetical protein JJE28_10305 [Actinomycetales bacterium]|nr:hypothetical protein [Actinomycetales bacterium]
MVVHQAALTPTRQSRCIPVGAIIAAYCAVYFGAKAAMGLGRDVHAAQRQTS